MVGIGLGCGTSRRLAGRRAAAAEVTRAVTVMSVWRIIVSCFERERVLCGDLCCFVLFEIGLLLSGGVGERMVDLIGCEERGGPGVNKH